MLVIALAFASTSTCALAASSGSHSHATAQTTKNGDAKPGSALAKRLAKNSSFENQALSLSTDSSSKKHGKSSGSSAAGALGRMLLGLVIVIAVIFGVYKLLKRAGKGNVGPSGHQGAIEVMATTPIAPNRALHLVKVGNEVVLIGATDTGITRLGSMDAQLLAKAAGSAGNSDFHMALAGNMAGASTSVETAAVEDSFFKRFVANLQMMTAR